MLIQNDEKKHPERPLCLFPSPQLSCCFYSQVISHVFCSSILISSCFCSQYAKNFHMHMNFHISFSCGSQLPHSEPCSKSSGPGPQCKDCWLGEIEEPNDKLALIKNWVSIAVRKSNRIPRFSPNLHSKTYQTSDLQSLAHLSLSLSYQTTWICILHDINSIHTIWVATTHGTNINALHGQKELQNSLVLSNWNPSDPTLAQLPHLAHLSSKNMKHHGVYVNTSIILAKL